MQTGRTQGKLVQVLPEAPEYRWLLTRQELLVLHWVHLLWTEKVGYLTVVELMGKIMLASSLSWFISFKFTVLSMDFSGITRWTVTRSVMNVLACCYFAVHLNRLWGQLWLVCITSICSYTCHLQPTKLPIYLSFPFSKGEGGRQGTN